MVFRRRREGKTDYRKRLKLLLSQKPRVVMRKSSKHTAVQLIVPRKQGDTILSSASSCELSKFGYKGATGNTPATYLTGLLFGLRALKEGHKEGVLDTGLQTSSKGSKVYAALKGMVDAGMDIPHDPSIFPDDGRIRGEHIANYANKEKDVYPEYAKRGLKATDLAAHVNQTKEMILNELAKGE